MAPPRSITNLDVSRQTTLVVRAVILALVAVTLGVGAGMTAAAFRDTADAAVSSFSAGTWTTTTAVAVGPVGGCTTGYVKHNGNYYVYAQVAGSPSSVMADVSALSTKAGPSPMVAGSWTIGGTTYNYRSAAEGADKALTEGPVTVTVDAGGPLLNGSVTIDNTKSTAVDIQTANGTGTAGIADIGDTVTFTYSEPIDACTVIPGWDGTGAQDVAVRLVDGGGSKDMLEVWNATNTCNCRWAT